ncbi:hypothetical protein CL622_05810 [archaeon]|nr:hypothetical protein [archaeon]
MNTKIRDYLGISGIIAMLLVAIASVNFVNVYDKSIEPSSFRSFVVSAQGEAVAIPDIAEFSFSVITEGGKDITTLQTKNSESVNRAIEYIKNQGVDEDDIRTISYNVNPRYERVVCRTGACPPAQIAGTTVTQSVSVKARDLSKAGVLLAGVVDNGANSVSGLTFTVDDLTEIQNEARAEAFKKAKEKAKDIAKAGDFKVGRLLAVDENVPGFSPIAFGRGGAVSLESAVPNIQPGSEEISVTINLTYEIQ